VLQQVKITLCKNVIIQRDGRMQWKSAMCNRGLTRPLFGISTIMSLNLPVYIILR